MNLEEAFADQQTSRSSGRHLMTDQPMFHLNLMPDLVAARFGELSSLVDVANAIREAKGNRFATDFLIKSIGLRINEDRNEEYYGEAFDYHMGLLLAHLGQEEEAVQRLTRSGVLPTGIDDAMFAFAVPESLRLHARQLEAAASGVPPILIASMPHAGSASLTQSLAASLDAPILHLSVGHFPRYILVPGWLNLFSRGGAVVHDHFAASPFNLRVLNEANWSDLVVLIRDPRACAASWVRKQIARASQTYPGEIIERRIVDTALNSFIPWLHGWIDAQQAPALRLHWIKFKETTIDMGAAVRGLLERYRPDHPALEAVIAESVQEVRAHFFRGDDDAWRENVGNAARRRLWDAMSPQAIELLELEP